MADTFSTVIPVSPNTGDSTTTGWATYASAVGSDNVYGYRGLNSTTPLTFRLIGDTSLLPSDAVIVGVQVAVESNVSSTISNAPSLTARVGTSVTGASFTAYTSSNDTIYIFGGATDTLGASSVADLANIILGFTQTNATSRTYFIDDVVVTVYWQVGPSGAGIMVLNPATITGDSWTNLDYAKVDDASYATETSSASANSSTGSPTAKFDFSALPAGATITGISCVVVAKASSAGYRKVFSCDAYKGSTLQLISNDTPLLTTDTTATFTFNSATVAAVNAMTVANRSAIEWSPNIVSTATGSVTTYLKRVYLSVTYTLPGGGVNVLFLGECF